MHFHISPLPSTLILLALASSLLAQPTPNPLEWIDFSLSRHFYPSIAAIPPPSGSSGGNTNHYCVAALDMGGVAYPLVQLTPARTSFECRGGQSGTWRPRLVFRGLEGASFSVIAAVIEGKAEIGPKGALGEVGVGIGYPTNYTSPASPEVFDIGVDDLSSRYGGGFNGTFVSMVNVFTDGAPLQRGKTVCVTPTTMPAIDLEFWITASQPNDTAATGDAADYQVLVSDLRMHFIVIWGRCDG